MVTLETIIYGLVMINHDLLMLFRSIHILAGKWARQESWPTVWTYTSGLYLDISSETQYNK